MIGFIVIPFALCVIVIARYLPIIAAGVFVLAALAFGYSVHWHLSKREPKCDHPDHVT